MRNINKIAQEVIQLRNYNFFEDRVDTAINKAFKALRTIDKKKRNKLDEGFKKLKKEIQNDFMQEKKKDKKVFTPIIDFPHKKIKDKEFARMYFPFKKSYVQNAREKIKEFLEYIDEIYNIFKLIKARFNDLN